PQQPDSDGRRTYAAAERVRVPQPAERPLLGHRRAGWRQRPAGRGLENREGRAAVWTVGTQGEDHQPPEPATRKPAPNRGKKKGSPSYERQPCVTPASRRLEVQSERKLDLPCGSEADGRADRARDAAERSSRRRVERLARLHAVGLADRLAGARQGIRE